MTIYKTSRMTGIFYFKQGEMLATARSQDVLSASRTSRLFLLEDSMNDCKHCGEPCTGSMCTHCYEEFHETKDELMAGEPENIREEEDEA